MDKMDGNARVIIVVLKVTFVIVRRCDGEEGGHRSTNKLHCISKVFKSEGEF
jgi:hypothetical protein